MATVSGLIFGWCIVLMFVCIRAMETVNSDADNIGGVYAIESRKRADTTGDSKTGEFVHPTNLQGNYDEYPMIVPKRAALLLDRLMVALHHALEEERNGNRRISEVFGRETSKTPNFLLRGGSLADFDPTDNDNMYSDEEQPDYDLRNLRDLKSPNRGSGETLMAKSFQRRAPHDGENASGQSNGRMYWRCYFNAVSCF